MTEKEMREAEVVRPKTKEELMEYFDKLIVENNDYNKAVYIMSMFATAAFYFASSQVGATGFQASCADMDFLRRTRHLKNGFRIMDYNKLLYPQYLTEEHFPSINKLVEDNKVSLKKKATELLKDSEDAHPDVKARWEYLAGLEV